MKNSKKFNLSIDDIPSDVFVCRFIDGKFTIVDANDIALRTIDIAKKLLIGKDILSIFQDLQGQESELLTILQKAQNSSQMLTFNIPCYIHDNLCRWHKGSVKSLCNGDLILYYKNIEREKELEIEELQYQLALISEAPYVGICIYDDKFLYINQVLKDILGYSYEELEHLTPIDLVEVKNKEVYEKNLYDRLLGKNFETAYVDVKLRKKDGSAIYTRLCVKTIKYRGKYRAFASIIDITDIVIQEQKTKRLAQAFEQTDDMLLITDLEGKIIYVNNRVVEKMGYSKEELLGHKTSIFKSGKHSQRFYKRLWYTILRGQKYVNTIINKTKRGKLIYVESTITPVFDKEGTLESFVATAKDITYQIKTKKKLQNLAMLDSLTKVLNRYALNKEIDRFIAMKERYDLIFSVLMFDIDYFKKINDTYGHYSGDVVLKNTTQLLSKNIRNVDKVGRWGGEEFIVILHATSQDKAIKKAEEFRKLIENNTIDSKYKITVSIGVTSYKQNDTKNVLLARVDKALYKAKEEGRNRVVAL